MRKSVSLDIVNNNTSLGKFSDSTITEQLEYDITVPNNESNSIHDFVENCNSSQYSRYEYEAESLIDEIQVLEKSRARLQQSLKDLTEKHDKEMDSKENELMQAKHAAKDKIDKLEQQLENEHNERLKLKRQNCELEKKNCFLHDIANRASKDLPKIPKMKREIGRLKILCDSAKNALERNSQEALYKATNRKLQEQLEDAEYSRNSGMKFRQHAERELKDLQESIEEGQKEKLLLEGKVRKLEEEKINFIAQAEESTTELHETMKKYENVIYQLSEHQSYVDNQSKTISNMEETIKNLEQKLVEMTNKLNSYIEEEKNESKYKSHELKIRELESKYEFQVACTTRIEIQNKRLKDNISFLKENQEQMENTVKYHKNLLRESKGKIRILEEDIVDWTLKNNKSEAKKDEYAKKLECSEAQIITLQNCLKEQTDRVRELEQNMLSDEVDNTLIPDDECDGISDDEVFMTTRRNSICSVSFQQKSRLSLSNSNLSTVRSYSRESFTNF